jgi:acetyltransferase EpsM
MLLSNNTKLLILGSNIFAEEVADLAEDTAGYEVSGFVENLDQARCQSQLLGKQIHWVDELGAFRDCKLISGIGTTKRRVFIEQVARYGLSFATLVHPSARISSTCRLGIGSILSVGAIVASHTNIGHHVIVNRGVLIGHHTTISDYVTISPGANIAGKCEIGTGSYIAMGAIIIDRVKIGQNSVVGAGSVVTKDVPDNVLVMGVPARIVKENVGGR